MLQEDMGGHILREKCRGGGEFTYDAAASLATGGACFGLYPTPTCCFVFLTVLRLSTAICIRRYAVYVFQLYSSLSFSHSTSSTLENRLHRRARRYE